MNNMAPNYRTFFMPLVIAILAALIFLPYVQKQQIAASAQPTATPVPGNDVVEFLAQIVPGTTRWSEINATLIGYGLSPYATYNDQGQVRGYGIPINVPRMGIFTAPYTQDISVGIGVQGDIIDGIQFDLSFVYTPNLTMPEVQWGNVAAVFRRLGDPSHLRLSVSVNAVGEGSNMESYWQDSGWFTEFGVGINPSDINGGVESLCFVESRLLGPRISRVPPGTSLEVMDAMLQNLVGARIPLEPNMLLNAPDIATVRQRILNDECLKTNEDYWFVFEPDYVSPTPWATDTPIPTATFTPTLKPNKPRLVTTDIQEIHAGWGEDSSFFYYTSATTEPQVLDVHTLTPVVPPLPRTLSQDALSQFGIDVSDLAHPQASYSVSPDGQYVIYTVVVDPDADTHMDNPYCIERHLRLGYIPDGTFIDLDFRTQFALSFEWFGHSTGVSVSDGSYGHGCGVFGEPGLIAYITGLSATLDSVRMIPFDVSDAAFFHTIHQASTDGRFLLVGGFHFRDGKGNPTLSLLDTQGVENSRILVEGRGEAPIVAWFKPTDPHKVLGINSHGLFEMDILTNSLIVLDALFSGSLEYSFPYRSPSPQGEFYVHEAWGSPDGQWLAYTHFNPEIDVFELYVVNLLDVLTPTDTIAPR